MCYAGTKGHRTVVEYLFNHDVAFLLAKKVHTLFADPESRSCYVSECFVCAFFVDSHKPNAAVVAISLLTNTAFCNLSTDASW